MFFPNKMPENQESWKIEQLSTDAMATAASAPAAAAAAVSPTCILGSSALPLRRSFLAISPLTSPKLIFRSKKTPKIFAAAGASSSSSSSAESSHNDFLSSILNSALVLAASVAISATLFVSDVGPASAFVASTPRKLQTDELATVRLFQENTPSVVYITNLATR